MKSPLQIQQKVTLAPFTSWKVGGPAEHFALPTSVAEVREALLWAKDQNLSVTVLGGGSNVLISDAGISGLVLCTQELSQVADPQVGEGVLRLTVLAGTPKILVMKHFLRENLAPALFLAGLPGDVGGGVVMNAGVAESREPREFGEIVEWVEVLRPDGSLVRLAHHDIQWTYRHASGWQPGVIVRVGLLWKHEPIEGLQRQVRDANRLRQSKQPLQDPSCGSTFKNPPGTSAGKLIDECGLKGHRIGGAQVSTKHANFIINTGTATAADIKSLINHVKSTVLAKTGIELENEVVHL